MTLQTRKTLMGYVRVNKGKRVSRMSLHFETISLSP